MGNLTPRNSILGGATNFMLGTSLTGRLMQMTNAPEAFVKTWPRILEAIREEGEVWCTKVHEGADADSVVQPLKDELGYPNMSKFVKITLLCIV